MSRPSDQDRQPNGATTRRRFLQALALGTAGATVFAGCAIPPHEFELQSRPRLAEDILSAYDNWYATTCRGCGAGCGVVVRVVEGRAKKVEGNPLHPVNRGKLCARGQALVQEQYHPDRIPAPLRRAGDRGSGGFDVISWDDALDEVVNRLRAIQQQGLAGDVWVLTRPAVAHQALIVDRFTQAFGARRLTLDPIAETPLRAAVRRVFGQDRLPTFDVERASYVLSFGANFLHTWLSPVAYGVQYGSFRQGSYDAGAFQPRTREPRGYLVQVDPYFSGTAANADEWVPVRPGYEGLLALGIASALVGEGLADAGAAGAVGSSLQGYQPEQIAAAVGVDAGRIRQIARDFAARGPGLAIGGELAGAQTNGTDNLAAILSLNLLVGNVGKPGGVLFGATPPLPNLPAADRASSLSDWLDLTQQLQQGRAQAVLVHEANPVYGLPSALGMRDALLRAPLVVSFSSFQDETTALADLILPSSLPLESWGDSVPEPPLPAPVYSIQQPVVQPFYDTRSFWDVLLVVGEELGGPVQQALPWPTVEAAVRDGARELLATSSGTEDEAFARAWTDLLQRGGQWPPAGTSASPAAVPGSAARPQPSGVSWQQPEFAGSEQEYPLSLVVHAHNTLGAGEASHLPWLQAAPDPITAVTWQTWVALNPQLAKQMGVGNGDVVTVETPAGRADVAVFVSPAAPPNVLSLPLGQGHQGFGRWAQDRGLNALTLVVPLTDAATDALAYGATRARLTKTGRSIAQTRLGGDVEARQLPGQQVIKITRLEH